MFLLKRCIISWKSSQSRAFIKLPIQTNAQLMALLLLRLKCFCCRCRSFYIVFLLLESFFLPFSQSQATLSPTHGVKCSRVVKKLRELAGSGYTFYFVWILHECNFASFQPKAGTFPPELVIGTSLLLIFLDMVIAFCPRME